MDTSQIRDLIDDAGVRFSEKDRNFITVCPACNVFGKCSISKRDGSTICYRGSCSFGKQGFADWYALTLGTTLAHALKIISGQDKMVRYDLLNFDAADLAPSAGKHEELIEVTMPPGSFPLCMDECERGVQYLISRGVSKTIAEEYGITYDLVDDRVVFPIKDENDRMVGWQGRSVMKVADDMKVRNNPGFSRASCVMFTHRLKGAKHAIIAEGPFDAMKFHLAGGNVATMGKNVSDRQIEIIMQPGIERVYLALDDDAFMEMDKLCAKISVPVYKPEIPRSCLDRCAKNGKKPDFGECTMEEALQAFNEAVRVGPGYVF